MINNVLLCADIVDKLIEAGIVVLIGVSLVFIVLFILIGVVKLLKIADGWLNIWDKKMAVYRANKQEVKALKNSYIDAKEEKVNLLYKKLEKNEIDKNEFKTQLAQIKQDYKDKKPEIKQAVLDLKAKQKAPKTTQTENTTVVQTEEVVTDAKLIAIISAALAVATEQEQQERKVTFKVRSIKHIK